MPINMSFSVLYKDEKVADVDIINNNVNIEKYTDVYYKQPILSCKNNIEGIYDFLKSRCYEDGRADLQEILKQANLEYNSPWRWVKISHGVT